VGSEDGFIAGQVPGKALDVERETRLGKFADGGGLYLIVAGPIRRTGVSAAGLRASSVGLVSAPSRTSHSSKLDWRVILPGFA
jgi:hypothetical protein